MAGICSPSPLAGEGLSVFLPPSLRGRAGVGGRSTRLRNPLPPTLTFPHKETAEKQSGERACYDKASTVEARELCCNLNPLYR
jgi:hypothetical protein